MTSFFLTGDLHCGKSTVVDKVLALSGRRVGGFRTAFGPDRALPNRQLYLYPAGGTALTDAAHVVAQYAEDRPLPRPEVFDGLGVACLTEGRPQLLIMDECGRLERDAPLVQAAILKALDGEIPVLGVLRQGFPGWTKQIAAHPKVRVIEVTAANRDELPAWLVAQLG
ncbi:MAG: nucleoside-triphosphatase [Pseudoflavonifractor sp.]